MEETIKKHKLEKPENCIICLEKLGEEEPLKCGHWVHMNCLKKHFKPECVICRTPLDIVVEGKKPDGDIVFNITQFLDFEDEEEEDDEDEHQYEEEDEDNEELEEAEMEEELEEWQKKGYLYPDESSDYDEENRNENSY